MTRFKNFEVSSAIKDVEIASDWTQKNLLAPFLNAACVEPINALSGAAERAAGSHHAHRIAKMDTASCAQFSAEFWSQSIASGLGSVISYACAGRLAGGGLRSIGSTLALEGTAAKIACNQSVAQIVGAGIYDANRDLQANETHLGNGLGGAASFGALTVLGPGSSKYFSAYGLLYRGVSGGVSTVIGDGIAHPARFYDKSPKGEQVAAGTFLSGAFMNMLLPGAHEGIARLHDRASLSFGKGIALDRYLKVERETALNLRPEFSLDKIMAEHRWTRIQTNAETSNFNHRKDLVSLRSSDFGSTGIKDLVHELQHRREARAGIAEPGYLRAKELLLKNDLSGAWSVFRANRMGQEIRARLAEQGKFGPENKTAQIAELKASIPKALAREGTTYEALWREEFLTFAKSKGESRPEIDYSGKNINPELEAAHDKLLNLMMAKEPKIENWLSWIIKRSDLEPQKVTQIFDSMSKIVSNKNPLPEQMNAHNLVRRSLYQIFDPNEIRQGYHPTCSLAALEHVTYSKHPENAAKLLAEVLRERRYITKDKTPISISELNILPEKYWHRSHGNQLFQNTAANIYWQRQPKFEALPDGRIIHSTPGPYGLISYERHHTKDLYQTPYSLVEKATGTQIVSKSPDELDLVRSPSLNYHGINDVYRQINGATSGDICLPPRIASPDEMRTALVDRKRDGLLPVIIAVDTRHKAFAPDHQTSGSGGLHSVVATKFDAHENVVSIFNPWGYFTPKMDLKDLWQSTQPID
ncbi:MAG: hypothetical protein IAF58_10085 [Leptolyngbya sp.]|nr:hypothetical protein [Candidatus Melainabacteria bacterium]